MAEMKFTVSHADDSHFTHDGLRPFFEYRDLQIKGSSQNNRSIYGSR